MTDDPKTKTDDTKTSDADQKKILKEEIKKTGEDDFTKKYGIDPAKPYTPVKGPTKQ